MIDSDVVYKYTSITEIICDVSVKFGISKNTNISFFKSQEEAGYKDQLLYENDSLISTQSYDKWLENAYLAEFDFTSREYSSYPSSFTKEKSSTIIETCP